MSSYRTQWREGLEAVIADDGRVVGQVFSQTYEIPLWIGRSTTRQLSSETSFQSRDAALAAVKRYAEEHPDHTFS